MDTVTGGRVRRPVFPPGLSPAHVQVLRSRLSLGPVVTRPGVPSTPNARAEAPPSEASASGRLAQGPAGHRVAIQVALTKVGAVAPGGARLTPRSHPSARSALVGTR